ncbi:MAG: hypothetical protein H6740_07955 [Alphaproteobacteria bacterium]|nr:hypothetical protein [Alphaproteobacteria bacterium]
MSSLGAAAWRRLALGVLPGVALACGEEPAPLISVGGAVDHQGLPVAGVWVRADDTGGLEALSGAVDGAVELDVEVGETTLRAELSGHLFTPAQVTVVASVDSTPEPALFTLDGAGWPTEEDAYADGAVLPLGGALQARSIGPCGGVDEVGVALVRDQWTSILTTNHCPGCSTRLALLDPAGAEVASAEPHFAGSWIYYRPRSTGTYTIRVEAPVGATYLLGAWEHQDEDGDGWIAAVDCDDTDPGLSPRSIDFGGDSRDDDCDGVLRPALDDPDADEPANNTPEGAIDLAPTRGHPEERQLRGLEAAAYGRSLHDPDDVDWYRVTVPPWGRVELSLTEETGSVRWALYGGDGVTLEEELGASFERTLTNPGASEQVWYLEASGGDATWIQPVLVDRGLDQDGDGATTLGLGAGYDCDDADAGVTSQCCGG